MRWNRLPAVYDEPAGKRVQQRVETSEHHTAGCEKDPLCPLCEAKRLVSEKYNRKIRNPFDLEPEEEELIGKYFKEEYNADLYLITHYPSKKRPFYAMDESGRYPLYLKF